MSIQTVDERLNKAKNDALSALGIADDLQAQIQFAPAPDPAMGDRGFPCFVLAKHLKKAPVQIAKDVADIIRAALQPDDIIEEIITAGPYVNIRYNKGRYAELVVGQALRDTSHFGANNVEHPEKWMIEYSAPNTNKPQHLGHVRNNLLGQTVSTILEFVGHKITRVNLINDRGIHICKSMLAYQLYGHGETPQSAAIKGDHLVGKYYVCFEQKFNEEYEKWQHTAQAQECFDNWLRSKDSQSAQKEYPNALPQDLQKIFFEGYKDDYFNQHSVLGGKAKKMLRDWESGDDSVRHLWQTMNQWVFDGFDQTYKRLGLSFDKVYYESDTYLLGKNIVEQGLADNKFETLPDGAIVCNLENVGLQGQKVLLRSDGTSVYMTQDLGTALQRFEEYKIDRMAYVVGNEQDYHFDVLFRILTLLKPELDGKLSHLSYGMVLLPEGKMKSREGKVVDADDLMDEMVDLACQAVKERSPELPVREVNKRAEVIGMAALKYYMMDFTPRSTVQFDPKKSIDFQGRTGPYCLYSYTRIQSIGRKIGGWPELTEDQISIALRALGSDLEMALIQQIYAWPRIVSIAARDMDPSKITEHLFFICKAFSSMYNDSDHKIINIAHGPRRDGLLVLSQAVGHILECGLQLLGIQTLPEM